MRRAFALGLAAVVASAAMLLGCSMNPLPLSAQAGSTVLIPVEFQQATLGFGGADFADPQRGELVYSLGSGDPPGPGGLELVTRFTILGAHDPRSANAADAVTSGRVLALSVVDIPATAPPGRHRLYVVRRDAAGDHPLNDALPRPSLGIRILPPSIEAGGETIVGAPSPLEAWSWLTRSWWPGERALAQLIPDPTLEIALTHPVSAQPVALHALTLVVTYPESVIDVTRAIPPPGLRNASFWIEPLAPGVVRVQAAAGDPFDRLGIVFRLDHPSTILDPDAVTSYVVVSGDRNGALVPVLAGVAGVR